MLTNEMSAKKRIYGGNILKKEANSKLKIIPLGGLEQIGMNITAFEYEDSIIVVDCGLSFPEEGIFYYPWPRGPYRSNPLYFKRSQCADLCNQAYDCNYRTQVRRA